MLSLVARLIATAALVYAAQPMAVLLAQQEAAGQGDSPLWTYGAKAEISFHQITALGSVVIATDSALACLQPSTGVPVWVRNDIAGLKEGGFESIPLTPYGMLRSKDGIALIDLETGRTTWDSTRIPLRRVRGYLSVVEHNLVLVYGESDASKQALVGVGMDSGAVRWVQNALFDKKPETSVADGIQGLFGSQPPLLDTDSTLILYISKDGPIRIHIRTGERLWWVDALKGKDVPLLSRWYAPLMLSDGVLLVPYEQRLMAVDARTGQPIWDRAKKFKSPLAQMQRVAQGLLVRGARPLDQEDKPIGMPDAFIDLVDLGTGASIWPKPFEKMRNESVARFLVDDQGVYFADRETLYQIKLADGSHQEVARYTFEGGEEPAALERRGGGLLVLADHNLIIVGPRGALEGQVFYPAPGSSLLSKVGKGLLFVAAAASQAGAADVQRRGGVAVWFDYNPFIKQRLEQNVDRGQFSYIYTRRPGAGGREGFSLVKVGRADLREVARIWMDERSADYVMDEITGLVFVKRGQRELVAFRFPGG